MSLPDRFWAKTAPSNCVVWTGAMNSRGYGMFRHDGESTLVHRLAWEESNGPIPDGLTIDHLCRNRLCLNLDHLEVVSKTENTRRHFQAVTKCLRGHDLTFRTRGAHVERRCATCENEAQNRRRRERMQAS